MLSQKKLTAVFGAIFAAAVLFFIGIVIFAELADDGSEIQVIDNGITVTEMRVDVVWKNDRSCNVTQTIDVKFNEYKHGIYVDMPVNSGERIRNLEVSVTDCFGYSVPYVLSHESANRIVRVKIGRDSYTYSPNDSMFCVVKYNLQTPVHPDGENLLDINAIGGGWACEIQNATVTVTFPKAVSNNDISAWKGGNETNMFELSDDGKTVTLQVGTLRPYNGVRVKAQMLSGVLKNSGFEGIVTVVVGIVLVVASVLLMVFLGKDKPLTPIVGFYPPRTDGKTGRKRYMLPIQLGKIIDGTCSSSDVTSLIFYWASEGYIEITETDGDTYLTKLDDIDPVTEYERVLFNALFKKAKRHKETGEIRVSINSLSGGFADKINAAKSAVNREYRGEFFRAGFTVLSVGMAVAAGLFAVLGSMLCTLRIASGFINLLGIITVVPVVLAYVLGTLLVRSYFKLSDRTRYVFLALYLMAVILVSVAVMLAVPTDAMAWTEKFVFAVCIGVTAAIAPFLTRRKDKYTEQLNEVIGFRNFLRDAEKPQLEMMLQEDPQYYYNILPYANVLGVSKIWQDKFKGLSIEPPTYYNGGDVSIFDIYVISRLSNSIGSSLTYTPPKVSSGSFSGGGHFGGGGGGSFGGFGGGGGGSW